MFQASAAGTITHANHCSETEQLSCSILAQLQYFGTVLWQPSDRPADTFQESDAPIKTSHSPVITAFASLERCRCCAPVPFYQALGIIIA